MFQRGLEEAIGSSPSLRSSAVIKIPRLEGQEELAAELEKVICTSAIHTFLSDSAAEEGKEDILNVSVDILLRTSNPAKRSPALTACATAQDFSNHLSLHLYLAGTGQALISQPFIICMAHHSHTAHAAR